MPGRSSSVRLSKAAKEFNVGLSTIVEFLKSKGIEIESKPNTKIDSKAYEILQDEFSESKKLKEKAGKVGVGSTKRETVSLNKERAPEPKRSEDDDGVLIKNVQGGADEEVIKPDVEKKPGLNVVGKIDLDKRSKEVAAKKEAEAAEKAEAEKKAKEEGEAAKAAAEKKAAEEKDAETDQKPAAEDAKGADQDKPAERETIKTNVQKLSGLTVVGKIDLPEKKKKPVMSTDPDTETQKGKRKRKRITTKPETQRGGKAGDRGRGRSKAGGAPREVSKEDIDRELKQTLAKISGGSGKGKGAKIRKQRRDDHRSRAEEQEQQAAADSMVLKLTEFVTVSDLASLMDVSVTEVISACIDRKSVV